MARFDGKRVSRAWRRVLTEARRQGVQFQLNSGRRTLAEQRRLYNQNMQGPGRPKPGRPMTAYPDPNAPHIRVGRPDHALDVNAVDGGETRLQRWLEKHGARPTNPVPGEAWHMELPAGDLLRLARKFRRAARRRRRTLRKTRHPYRLGWRSIRHVCPHLSEKDARRVADALGPAFAAYDITTRKRAAAAVAQFAHESAGFRTTVEYASGEQYEGRKDLGNTRKGDGRRFKGRGYIQITGRANYKRAATALGHDFTKHPDDLAKPEWAARASCWWWKQAGCNELADKGDFVALTRRINGGTNGLEDRKAYHRRAQRVSRWLVPKRRKN